MSKIDKLVASMDKGGSPMKRPAAILKRPASNGSNNVIAEGAPKKRPSSNLKRPASKVAKVEAEEEQEADEECDEEGEEQIEGDNTMRVKARFVSRNLMSFSAMFQDFWKNSSQSEKRKVLKDSVEKNGRNYELNEDGVTLIAIVPPPPQQSSRKIPSLQIISFDHANAHDTTSEGRASSIPINETLPKGNLCRCIFECMTT